MSAFPVMLARTYSAVRVTDWSSLVVEPKLDGVRVVAKVMRSGVQFFSRNGRVLTMFDHLVKPLTHSVGKLLDDYGVVMVDGEMLSGTRFEDIGGAIHRKDHTEHAARFHAFFSMPWTRFRNGKDAVPQDARMKAMEYRWRTDLDNPLVTLVPCTFVTASTMVEAAAKDYVAEGYEGVMVKQVNTPYGGRRSYDWMKWKTEHTVDVRVVSLQPGKGKYTNTLGALVVTYRGRTVDVSGMTDAQRDEWWNKPKSIIGKHIEVKYQYVTDKGSLRHPRFVRLRPDKD